MSGRLATFAAVCVFALPALAQAPGAAAQDRAAIEKIVHEYLVQNPEVLLEAMTELRRRQEAAAADASKQTLAMRKAEIFDDPDSPVGGNPNGNVTIVEFFDYHCGYCKQVHEPLLTMLGEDKQLRIVYKELPILAPESRIAAAAALAANRQGRYVDMHNALMAARGKLTKDRILALAKEMKLDVGKLAKDMELPEIEAAIDRNLQLATALGVEGTPAFVIGDLVAPGALDISQLRKLVADARR